MNTTMLPNSLEDWFDSLAAENGVGSLLHAPQATLRTRGYEHTLREICQQPVLWRETESMLIERAEELGRCVEGAGAIVLTGSGSSLYAGECAAPYLQGALGVPVTAVGGGDILTHPELCLPPSGPYLVVSLARSGDSPESRAVVDWLLEEQPRARQVFITCNPRGALASSSSDTQEILRVLLDERTLDKSLVMTSSFTNLVLAARGLDVSREPGDREARVQALAQVAADILRYRVDDLAGLARSGFGSAVFLASACRIGSAREAALKMLEMTAGEVWTLTESYLGLRHGPMSAVSGNTLIVAFLASDPMVRAYELDTLEELRRKQLGARRLIVGAGVPQSLAAEPGDVIVDCSSTAPLADDELTMLDALVGQLLAFFRCMDAGLQPDSPSSSDVITRVVSDFLIHRRSNSG